jgi:hypothetical protein
MPSPDSRLEVPPARRAGSLAEARIAPLSEAAAAGGGDFDDGPRPRLASEPSHGVSEQAGWSRLIDRLLSRPPLLRTVEPWEPCAQCRPRVGCAAFRGSEGDDVECPKRPKRVIHCAPERQRPLIAPQVRSLMTCAPVGAHHHAQPDGHFALRHPRVPRGTTQPMAFRPQPGFDRPPKYTRPAASGSRITCTRSIGRDSFAATAPAMACASSTPSVGAARASPIR